MPIAAPTMPFSASGVSSTRSSPNSACRPSVARNTPPALPTSSPSTRTRGFSRRATASPSRTACTIVSSAMAAHDLLHDGAGRAPLHQRNAHDAPASRLHGVLAHDGVLGVIGALHEHVGLEPAHQVPRRVLVEEDHRVHRRQGSEHAGPVLLGHERPALSLEAARRGVGVHAHDQHVAQGARALQEIDVPGVQEIEDAVREHDALALPGELAPPARRFLQVEHASHAQSVSADWKEALSSSGETTAVPAWRMTRPAAWLARLAALTKSAPAASASAMVATTVSPAPVTSNTSRATVGRCVYFWPRSKRLMPSGPRVITRHSRS